MDESTTLTKKILPSKDVYIQFTEEEVDQLGLEAGQNFSVELTPDGHVLMKPYVKLEVDFSELPREILENIIAESCDRDVSANNVIVNMLKAGLDRLENEETTKDGEENK
jgi:hypothetical protein